MMRYLQRLGKALMLPVACLPIAGILMGLGYLLSPPALQDVSTALTPVMILGNFLVEAGGAIIANMSLLFAVGVAVGMSAGRDGTAALSGLIAWLMIQNLLAPDFAGLFTGPEAKAAFASIDNQFIGIMSGLIGAFCSNRSQYIRLPDFLAFFSGRRAAPILTACAAALVSAVLLFIWPLLYALMIEIGKAVLSLGAAGAGIYVCLNRLLIPFGLHHALNAVVWFDLAGISDLTDFWSGEGIYGVTGMYMTGFFPLMMFGIPGAALAMYSCALPQRRRAVLAFLVSAAFCSFFTGVTEPFEFAFMFSAPGLYLLYALMSGLTAMLTVLLPIRAGFSFSAGLLDLIFSAQMPLAQNPWLLIPVGLIAFILFFLVFRFVILRFDLKTPGRDPLAEIPAPPPKAAAAQDKYWEMAQRLLSALGGRDNILTLDNCITRLRVEIKDPSLIDDAAIKAVGAAGVLHPDEQTVQIVIGTQVQFAAAALKQICAFSAAAALSRYSPAAGPDPCGQKRSPDH